MGIAVSLDQELGMQKPSMTVAKLATSGKGMCTGECCAVLLSKLIKLILSSPYPVLLPAQEVGRSTFAAARS